MGGPGGGAWWRYVSDVSCAPTAIKLNIALRDELE